MSEFSFKNEQLEQLKFALDQSSIVAITNAQGIIIYVNELLCKISGYSKNELIGKDHRILNSGYHKPEFFAELWQTIISGKVWKGIFRNKRKNGTYYWVDTTIVPFLDKSGKPYQYLAIRHDITALKEAEEIIISQQQHSASGARLAAIGEMAAAITHEINNPLAVIVGRTEMLMTQLHKQNLDVNTIQRLASTIETNASRIEKIIRAMRTISHNDGSSVQFEAITIQSIVEQTLDLCSERFKNNGYDLRLLMPSTQIVIECSGTQIFQVLLNLLNNAFDATHKMEKKWVELNIQDKNDFLAISVTDCGQGISEENQSKIFQPFFSTKSAKYGTGLGLSISKSIIEKHHGKIYYDSLHPNTRFALELPKKQKILKS